MCVNASFFYCRYTDAIIPACLPKRPTRLDDRCWVTGWGDTHGNTYIDYCMAFFIAYPLSVLVHDITSRIDRLNRGMIYERGLIKGII